MNAVFDLSNEDIERSVAEAVAWCAGQHLTTSIPREIAERRMLVLEANKSRAEGYVKSERFWNKLFRHGYQESPEFKRALELCRDVEIDSLASPLSNQLRTPDLKPGSMIGATHTNHERKNLVSAVIHKRHDALHLQRQGRPPDAGDGQSDGRMLIYVPEENVEDGASEFASSGFFDPNDAPPWDVWIAFSNHTLLAWVSPQLIRLAQNGIDVNAVDCIRWLD